MPSSIASTNLHRRLLFPSLSPDSTLPPLLPSPDLSQELYTLVALVLRAYVNPWWTKITRYDKEFLPELNRLIAIVIRSLVSRLAATDLSPLLYHDIPVLITQHYRDIRNASSKLSTSYAAGGSTSLPVLFHQLQPHMAIDGEKIDEVYIRHVLDHILKCSLPPEDYAPEPERFIIREVALKVVLQDVIPKITEPWFLYKTVLDLVGPVEVKPHIKVITFYLM
jgi:PXA domain